MTEISLGLFSSVGTEVHVAEDSVIGEGEDVQVQGSIRKPHSSTTLPMSANRGHLLLPSSFRPQSGIPEYGSSNSRLLHL